MYCAPFMRFFLAVALALTYSPDSADATSKLRAPTQTLDPQPTSSSSGRAFRTTSLRFVDSTASVSGSWLPRSFYPKGYEVQDGMQVKVPDRVHAGFPEWPNYKSEKLPDVPNWAPYDKELCDKYWRKKTYCGAKCNPGCKWHAVSSSSYSSKHQTYVPGKTTWTEGVAPTESMFTRGDPFNSREHEWYKGSVATTTGGKHETSKFSFADNIDCLAPKCGPNMGDDNGVDFMPAGYRLEACLCTQNVCKPCANGKPAGHALTGNLRHDIVVPFDTDKNGRLSESEREAAVQNVASAAVCPRHNSQNQCVECDKGYHLVDGKCQENKCVCPNGALDGKACRDEKRPNGAFSCKWCGGLYTFDASDKCYLTYCNANGDLQKAFCGGKCSTAEHAEKCRGHWVKHGSKEAQRFSGVPLANPTTCAGDKRAGCTKKHKCACPHGTGAEGLACPSPSAHRCTSCKKGYYLGLPRCEMTVASGGCAKATSVESIGWFDDDKTGGPRPSSMQACESRRASWQKTCGTAAKVDMRFTVTSITTSTSSATHDPFAAVCVPNVCDCENGSGATGTSCPDTSVKKCTSCDAGYELQQDACVVACTCANGKCAKGATECNTGCNTGYTLAGVVAKESGCLAAAIAQYGDAVTFRPKKLVSGSWKHILPGCTIQQDFKKNKNADWSVHWNKEATGQDRAGGYYARVSILHTPTSATESECFKSAIAQYGSRVAKRGKLAAGSWNHVAPGCVIHAGAAHFNRNTKSTTKTDSRVLAHPDVPEPERTSATESECFKSAIAQYGSRAAKRGKLAAGSWNHVAPGCVIFAGAAHFNRNTKSTTKTDSRVLAHPDVCVKLTCLCQDGTPLSQCPALGSRACASCNTGFVLKDAMCKKNACKCPDGTAATGTACKADGAAQCTSCNTGFVLKDARCKKKTCKCPGGTAPTGTVCKADGAAQCTSCNTGYRKDPKSGLCAEKECFCWNGVGAKGAKCEKHGDQVCTACNDASKQLVFKKDKGMLHACGLYFDDANLAQGRCVIKQCRCVGGKGTFGSKCPKLGNWVCQSCSKGQALVKGKCKKFATESECFKSAIAQYGSRVAKRGKLAAGSWNHVAPGCVIYAGAAHFNRNTKSTTKTNSRVLAHPK